MLRKKIRAFAVAALALAACAGVPRAEAQGIGRLLESLTGSRSSAAEKEGMPPAGQLEWAREQLADAQKTAAEAASPEFSASLEAAGVPPDAALEFQKLSAEAVRLWESSIPILEGVVLESQIAPEESIAPPENPQEAASLEARLASARAASANAAKEIEVLRREQSSNHALIPPAEAAALDAGRALEAATPENREALSFAAKLADLRLASLRAKAFYLAWATYRAESEQRRADASALDLELALDRSPYNRLLDSNRISALAKETEAARPFLLEQLEKAVAAHEKAAEAVRSLNEKTASGAARTDPKLAGQQRAAVELLRRKESLRLGSQLLVEINSIQQKEWNLLLQALETNTAAAWREARDEIDADARQIEIFRPRVEARIAEVRSSLDSFDREIESPGLSAARKAELGRLRDAATDQLKMLIELQNYLASLRSTQDRLLIEIESRIAEKGIAEKLAVRWSRAVEMFGTFWNYPLTITEGRAVTTGKIILAILGFLIGVLFARRLSLHTARALHQKLHLQEGQIHVAQSLLFYGLVAVFFLTTLSWLNIPLTVFAFLGGALMVGIGFGSQNLMNNFISGLIILAERKVSVGDLVEVDTHIGRVVSLGSRCCAIRKFDGVEVLVPNSFLLEKYVVNWTLSDPNHRYDFTIGVAYGSDTAKVTELLLSALREPSEVLEDPPPAVYFEAFGDSALVFRCYFWLRIGVGNGLEVGSRIRLRMDALLRENQIGIPFPQRDVNLRIDPATLHSLKPGG